MYKICQDRLDNTRYILYKYFHVFRYFTRSKKIRSEKKRVKKLKRRMCFYERQSEKRKEFHVARMIDTKVSETK